MDTIEQTIANAKEKRQKADALETLQNLQAEGVPIGGEEAGVSEVKHLAQTAQNVTDAMHTSLKAELVELHSFIPKELLPSVYEIALIAQAGYKEQRQMTKSHVLDPISHLQNEIIVQELLENARILMRQLAALNGFRAIQGEHNIGSLVGGVNAQLTGAGMNGMFPLPVPQKNILRRAINYVTGSK